MTTDTAINISENPHIVLGKGTFAISHGTFLGAFGPEEPDQVVGCLCFHPLIAPQDINALDDAVDVSNVDDPANPLLSLLFTSIESAERLRKDIDLVIKYMEQASHG